MSYRLVARGHHPRHCRLIRVAICLGVLSMCAIGAACSGDAPASFASTTVPTTTVPATGVTTSLASLGGEKEPDLDPTGEKRLRRISYGEDPLQAGDLRVPPGDGPFQVVVFIHGGFWRSGFDSSLMTPLAEDVTARGVATWNVDYRSVGDPGGGYPGTLDDIARAIDHLAQVDEPLALDDVIVIGHSAGGHLALWAGSRGRLSPSDPGARPVVEPHTVVAQAAVVDLRLAAEVNLGWGAVEALLGGEPDEVPERYRVAQPVFDGYRIIAVHGRYDQIVPISQSALIPGAVGIFSDTGTHFDVLDPRHDLWLRTVAELALSSPN